MLLLNIHGTFSSSKSRQAVFMRAQKRIKHDPIAKQVKFTLVMEIGEKIMFLKHGHKAWEGSKDTIFRTDNEVVTDFVYSSNLFKKVRKMYLEDH